jgi:tetratricopeptide (TPR) repeat protein
VGLNGAGEEVMRLAAAAYNRLGYVAHLQGSYAEALHSIDTASALLAALPSGGSVAELAQNQFVRGVLATTTGDWSAAENHFRTALGLWEDAGGAPPRMVAWSRLNLGTALRRLQRLDEATECYREAIEVLRGLGDFVHAALARNNLGNLHLDRGEPAEALACFQAAEPPFRAAGDQLRLALVYSNQGVALHALGDLRGAERALGAGVERWRILGHKAGLAEALCDLAQVLAAAGRTTDALVMLQDAQEQLQALPSSPNRARIEAAVAAVRAAIPGPEGADARL